MESECIYCGTNTKIKCYKCDLNFCNNHGSSSSSHIIFHLARNGHNEVVIDDKILECSKCKARNVFKLGFNKNEADINERIQKMNIENNKKCNIDKYKKKKDVRNNSIDNMGESDSENESDGENESESDNESKNDDESDNSNVVEEDCIEKIDYDVFEDLVCRDCANKQEFTTIISERCIVKDIVLSNNIMKNKNAKVEVYTPNYVSTRLIYTEEEYVNIYTFLLTKECEQEKMIKENLKQNNVHIRMEVKRENKDVDINGTNVDKSVWYCGFNLKDAETKIRVGDEILIYNDNVKIHAFVVQNYNVNDDVRARIYKIKGSVRKEDVYFTVEYIWKSVGMERMKYVSSL